MGKRSGTASGNLATDYIAVVGYSVSKLKFAAVKDQTGEIFASFWVHGGLGINFAAFHDANGYIQQLIDLNIISKRIVGLYLSNNDSQIQIGGYNAGKASDIQYFDVKEYQAMFDVQLKSLQYSGLASMLDHKDGLIMVHSPYMLFPSKVFSPIAAKIQEKLGHPCAIDILTGLFYCEVTSTSHSQFEGLIVQFQRGDNYTIHASNYIDFTEENGKKLAIFRIIVVQDLQYVGIGTPFLKSVYTVLDHDQDKVGFGQIAAGSTYGVVLATLLALALILI